MDSGKLNDWLQIAGLFAVLVGIVLVALELRQNAELTRAQIRAEMAQDTVSMLTLGIDNSEYVEAINRGIAGEELTGEAATQFRRTYNAWIWHWNNLAYQHRLGLYDHEEFDLQVDVIRADMETFPGMKRHWCRAKGASKELISAIHGTAGEAFCDGYH